MDRRVVSGAELEELLDEIARRTADSRAGIFGPGSVTWKINREAALFLGAGRAALLQLAHPWVAAALEQHSSLMNDPIARFHNTFRIVFTMVFGSLEQATAAARSLHSLHTGIRGELPEAAGGWARGSHYEANEMGALCWVYATLVESAVLAYEFVLPLEVAEREQYYRESKTMAALFGIPAEALPAHWGGFQKYGVEMALSGELGVGPRARAMARWVLSGAGSWVHPPRWYQKVTIQWIPEPIRGQLGLTLRAEDEWLVRGTRQWLPRFWRTLPPILRFVGPYREALARLGNRSVGPITRASNRFWIGQSQLPFTEGL